MAAEARSGRRGAWAVLELETAEVQATLLPEKGCDIVELIDRESGVDVLLKTPWVYRPRPVHAANSFEAWIGSYPGGWQVLLPNGGDASVENGVEWGFHGEAAMVAWQVDEHGSGHAVCSTQLLTAPLHVRRSITLDRSVLRIEEEVRNASDEAVEVMWGHHPAFGAPFLEPGCTVAPAARTFTADDRTPGAGLAPGVSGEWPHAALEAGGTLDLSVIPPEDERRAVLGYLGDFDSGSCTITNPRLGLAVDVRWPLELFPKAWFWQELRASPGYPWYRQLYATAVEPNSSAPAQGLANVRTKGGIPLMLAPGSTRSATVEAELRRVRA